MNVTNNLQEEISRLKYLLIKEYLKNHNPDSLEYFLMANDIKIEE